ncbi:hypothetical protein [Streptomyces turgidiscabies]|uniref:hypothetical protein n=1 Tax=Streptomyces turgidiscabies TaxID=85558 RepID=UPI0038F5DEEB
MTTSPLSPDGEVMVRRANIREKLDLLGRRGILGASGTDLLKQLVEAEMRLADAAERRVEATYGTVDALKAELGKAQAAVARVRRLSEMTIQGSVRVHARQQALDTLATLDGVSSPADAPTPVTAAAEADVQRVVELYERWVKAGPPPLGTSISRWWDKRLLELRQTVIVSEVETPS